MIDIPRPAAAALIHLFQGPVERDRAPETWRDLTAHQQYIRPYCAVLGLEVYLDEADGFAFLRQRNEPEDTDSPEAASSRERPDSLPRLISRHSLSFRMSVLLVLLRKRLLELDAGGSDTRLVVSRGALGEELRLFWPESTNEVKTEEQIDALLKQAVEFGLLRKLKTDPPTFEVRRLIKALIDAQWLAVLDNKLAEYRGHVGRVSGESDEESQ
jgi:hypothetical protein